MNSDADRFWDEIAPLYRKYKGYRPMTPEEADRAFEDAPEIAMDPEEIQIIVDAVVAGKPPEWESVVTCWSPNGNLDHINEEMLALHREEGDADPETDAAEEELRKGMLNDEPTDEDGLEGGATLPGEGREDG
jgi:hypothetical protein